LTDKGNGRELASAPEYCRFRGARQIVAAILFTNLLILFGAAMALVVLLSWA
jgi:hypothetical protein